MACGDEGLHPAVIHPALARAPVHEQHDGKRSRARRQPEVARELELPRNRGGAVVMDVERNSPAFNAGIANGSQIIAVNGSTYSAEALRRAITEAKDTSEPIELIVKTEDEYRTVAIDYHDGLRYPRLERIPGAPDRLSAILRPRTH